MKPLDSYLVCWLSTHIVYLAEVKKQIQLERWELVSSIEGVCELLSELKENDDKEAFSTVQIVSPTGFVYDGAEFLTEFCPCANLKESQPAPVLFVVVV